MHELDRKITDLAFAIIAHGDKLRELGKVEAMTPPEQKYTPKPKFLVPVEVLVTEATPDLPPSLE